jgi:hypothetical protein
LDRKSPTTGDYEREISTMKLMPLRAVALLSIAAAGSIAATERSVGADGPGAPHFAVAAGPIWPSTGVAERELVGDNDSWPENMFVEHSHGKWTIWVLASPAHGQTKAMDFFSGEVQNVTVQSPGDYTDAFIDAHGVTHERAIRPAFPFKDPRPGGAMGNNVHVNVSLIEFDSSVGCGLSLDVSERLSGDFDSSVWRKVILYPEPRSSQYPRGNWESMIGTGLDLLDGTMLMAAGNYVFRVSVDDLAPVGSAPHLHVLEEADVRRVVDQAKGRKIEDCSAYLTEQLGLDRTTPHAITKD